MVTALRSKQEELSATNGELRRTLSELDRQNEELKRINQFKSELVSMMAHELRTPLNSVKIFLDLIMSRELGEVNSEVASAVEKSLYNVNRLIRMVNDFLDLSNMEAGKIKMSLEPTSIEEVVRSSIIGVKAFADEGQVTIEVGKAPNLSAPLLTDRGKIEQVLINLLSNAIKFTPPGGKVTVDISQEGDQLQVNVTDTGVGIPEIEVDKVFNKFQKFSSKPFSKTKGSGLGLAISKAIVSAHGGEIWVKSKEGTGSTFSFTLPLGESPVRKASLGEI
jgi:signal transduction histidine kinase